MLAEEVKSLARSYRRCFDCEAGQTVLDHLSRFCMEHRSTYVPGNTDQTAFNEGARTVILEIRKQLTRDLETPVPDQTVNEEGTDA